MRSRDWILPPHYLTCPEAESLYRTALVIFSNLDGSTTPEQFAAAQESLEQCRSELEQTLSWRHYGVSVGTHRCIRHVFQEATARLRCLAVVQPPPLAPAAQSEQHLSLADLVSHLEETKETYLGNKEETHDAPGTAH